MLNGLVHVTGVADCILHNKIPSQESTQIHHRQKRRLQIVEVSELKGWDGLPLCCGETEELDGVLN